MVSEIRRRVCARTVQAVVFFGVVTAVCGLAVALTVLYNVPQDLPDDINTYPVSMNGSNTSTSESLDCTGSAVCNASKLLCSDGFYVGDGAGPQRCRPECGEWEELPHGSALAFDVFVVLQAIVCIVSTIILVVLSAIRYKRMFKFPSILIVYATIPVAVFELFLLIGYKNRKSLFCSSRDLIESLKSPTVFCSLQGAVFYYNILQLTLMWFFHIVVLFWGIKFPVSYKNLKNRGHIRYLHVSIVLLSLVLPVIPVAVGFGTGGYTVPRFPPTICIAINADGAFYSFILPLTLLMVLGVSLVIGMFCLLCGMSRTQATHPENANINLRGHVPRIDWKWKAEIKLLVIFCYFFIFLAVSQTALTIAVRNQRNFITQLTAYFMCESMGIHGNSCEKSFGRLDSKVSLVISYLFLGLYPVINLLYVVNVKELKNSCSRRKENCSISGIGSMPQLPISSSGDYKTEI